MLDVFGGQSQSCRKAESHRAGWGGERLGGWLCTFESEQPGKQSAVGGMVPNGKQKAWSYTQTFQLKFLLLFFFRGEGEKGIFSPHFWHFMLFELPITVACRSSHCLNLPLQVYTVSSLHSHYLFYKFLHPILTEPLPNHCSQGKCVHLSVHTSHIDYDLLHKPLMPAESVFFIL